MKRKIKEIWKSIIDFEGIYEVSNLGNVRSIDRLVKNKKGGYRKVEGKNLSLRKTTNGYMQVDLYKNGKQFTIKVHRLVAMAFIPNPNDLPVVNHKDTIRHNNYLDNLEWVTYSENNLYAYMYGNRRKKVA